MVYWSTVLAPRFLPRFFLHESTMKFSLGFSNTPGPIKAFKWKGKDGKLKPDFVNSEEWVVMGGDYFDTEYNEQLQWLFDGTEWQKQANDMFEYETFIHSDVFSESNEEQIQEARERAEQAMKAANNTGPAL